MHRSGTSLVSQIANLIGLDLGPEDQMIEAGPENPKGFWENSHIKRLNEEVLERMGGTWFNPPILEPGWECSSLLDDLRQEAGDLISGLASRSAFGWKDPRTSLTLPFWRTVVNVNKCVVVIRQPEDVAKSLMNRNAFSVERAQYLWLRYTISALSEAGECLVVRYEDVLEYPFEAISKLVAYLDLDEPSDGMKEAAAAAVDSDLNRSSQGSGPEGSLELANSVYRMLSAEAPERLTPVLGAIGAGPVAAAAMKQLAEERGRQLEELEGGLAEQKSRGQELESQLAEAKSWAEELERGLGEEKSRAEQLERDLTAERGRVEELRDQLSARDAEAEGLKSDRDAEKAVAAEMRDRATEAEREVDKLRNSRSWVVTKPLRVVSWRAKKVVRRGLGPGHAVSELGRVPGASSVVVRGYRRFTPYWIKSKIPRRMKRSVYRHVNSRHSDPDELGWDYSASRGFNLPAHSVGRKALHPDEERLVDKSVTIAVIAWDVCHNPLGRAYLLSEALSRYFNVLLLGPAFPRFGGKVWEPLEEETIPVVPLPPFELPEFIDMGESVAKSLHADVVVSCKLRFPSLLLGLLGTAGKDRPLVVDVDDYESAFVEGDATLDLERIVGQPQARWRSPDADEWTRYAENLIHHADEVWAASEPLRRRYGGVVVPHARDEIEFDPGNHDRDENRKALGFDESDRVVLFAGTARTHKGVFELLEAVASIDDERVKLLIVGRLGNVSVERKRLVEAGRIVEVGNRPLSELPVYLNCADAVVLPHHPDTLVANYQLPAKVVDALAFGVPILATETPPVRELIQEGLIEATTLQTLREDILRVLFTDEGSESRARRREYFLKYFSYSAVGRRLAESVWRQLNRPQGGAVDGADVVTHLSRRIRSSVSARPSSAGTWADADGGESGVDIVLVWKQHDMFLYGRRPEMLVRYLANEPKVRRVVVVEPPVGSGELWNWSRAGLRHQNRAAYVEWMRKSWGVYNQGKIRTFAFTYASHEAGREQDRKWKWPQRDEYMDALSEFFAEEGIDVAHSTFIVCPKNEWIPEIVERFCPAQVVSDVVDDHRTWPDINQQRVAELNGHYARVLGLSNFVTVNCGSVLESMREFHEDVRLLPNGIDASLKEDYPVSRRFQEMLGLQGPIIGYVGNLEKKIDVGLLHSLATEKPEWNVVLVGSVHANPEILELDALDNVYFAGVVPYEEAKHWVRKFDVGIMPHRDIPLTRNMSPLKLYVYLGLGIPVVSTGIRNIPPELSRFISVADSVREFISAIDSFLNGASAGAAVVPQDVIENNSWEERVRDLLAWLVEKRG